MDFFIYKTSFFKIFSRYIKIKTPTNAKTVTSIQVVSKPNLATNCIPTLWLKICDKENAILYKAMYSPLFPFSALSMAKAFENGKAIISPIDINKIPIIKTPTQPVKFKIIKLKPTRKRPKAINLTLDWYLNFYSNKSPDDLT